MCRVGGRHPRCEATGALLVVGTEGVRSPTKIALGAIVVVGANGVRSPNIKYWW